MSCACFDCENRGGGKAFHICGVEPKFRCGDMDCKSCHNNYYTKQCVKSSAEKCPLFEAKEEEKSEIVVIDDPF